MPRTHPNKVTVPGTPPIVVTLVRRTVGKDGTKSGNWFYRFWWRGVLHRGTTETDDKATAFSVATLRAQEAMQAEPAKGARLTLQDAIDKSVETRWPAADSENRSYHDARVRLDNFARAVGADTTITTLTTDGATQLAQKYLDQRRAAKKSAQTITNDRLVISAFYAWLRQRKLVGWARNPADKDLMDTPEVTHRVSAPLTDEEITAGIEAARASDAFPAVVLCLSGFRPRGASRVLWSDINLDAQTVTVLEKLRQRAIPLSDWAAKELRQWRKDHPAEDSTPVVSSHSALYKWMKTVKKAAGCQRVTLQALRRAFLFRLFKNNVSPQLAAKLAGNSVPTIQKHYVDMETLDARAVVNVLNFAPPAHKAAHKKAAILQVLDMKYNGPVAKW